MAGSRNGVAEHGGSLAQVPRQRETTDQLSWVFLSLFGSHVAARTVVHAALDFVTASD